MRVLAAASFLLAMASREPAARAEPSPPARAHVRVHGACAASVALEARLEAMGTSTDGADADAPVVLAFRTRELGRDGLVEGEVVLTDIRGVVLARRFADSCESVADALALAAAHMMEAERDGLVDRRARVSPDPVDASLDLPRAPGTGDATSSYWPAPVDRLTPEVQRRGGGGVLALGGVGFGAGGFSKRAHAVVAFRLGRTRIGASAAFGEEDRFVRSAATATEHGFTIGGVSTRTEQTTRAALALGWGAPWKDGPAGFLVEAGPVLATRKDGGEPRRTAGAFVAWSLVLMAPVKGMPVRPVALLGGQYSRTPDGSVLAMTAEAGLVWQAF